METCVVPRPVEFLEILEFWKLKFVVPSCSTARDLPIVRMVEEFRNLLQRWFSNCQQQTLSMKTELTTWAGMELCLRYNKSSGYEVEPINSWEFNVKYARVSNQVNL